MDLRILDRLQESRRREAEQRRQIYARLEEEANPLQARIRRAREEGMEEVTVDDFEERPKRQPPLRRRPEPAENRADRLRVLFEKIQKEVSILTLRNVYDKAKKIVKNDPAFRDLKELPPTVAEVREWLSDKPRFQAQFPVNDWPGRNQLGQRQNEILGADLIEFEKTSKMVPGNLKDGELMKHILVIGDRFTRKLWHIVLANKETETVIQGFKELMPTILQSSSTGVSTRRTQGKEDRGRPKQIVVDSAPWALSREFEEYMKSLGIVVRNKNSSNRQELQNNSVLDSAIHKIQ